MFTPDLKKTEARFCIYPKPLDDFGLLIGCQQPSSELLEYAPETRSVSVRMPHDR
jgi:hypothetical protein